MAITLRTAGTWAASTANPTVTLPTHQEGDMLLVRVAWKSDVAASASATINTAGWTKIGQGSNGTTNASNGGGSVFVAAFFKVAESSSETNPTVTFADNNPAAVVGMAYQKGSTEMWISPKGNSGPDTTSGTGHSATIASLVRVYSGDVVDFFTGIADDTTMTVPTITQTGVTFNTVTESPATALSSTTGFDISADGGYRTATAGTATAAAVVTGTLSTAETGTSWMTVLRVMTPPPTGQANARIKAIGVNQHGQAQSKIKAFGVNQHGQAQAFILAPIRVYGQAKAAITYPNNVEIVDTFTRADNAVVGNAESPATNNTWIEIPGGTSSVYIVGNTLGATVPDGDSTGIRQLYTYIPEQRGQVTFQYPVDSPWIDLYIELAGTLFPSQANDFWPAINNFGLGFIINDSADLSVDVYTYRLVALPLETHTDIITVAEEEFYTIKWELNYKPTTNVIQVRYKIWLVGTAEPSNWEEFADTTRDINTHYQIAGGISGIKFENHGAQDYTIFVDNYKVEKYIPQGYGQAQARIILKSSGLGQAQATIVPLPKQPLHICTAACGMIGAGASSASGNGNHWDFGQGVVVDDTEGLFGSRSYFIEPIGTAAYLRKVIVSTSHDRIVGKAWVKIDAWPTDTANIIYANVAAGSAAAIQVDATTHEFEVQIGGDVNAVSRTGAISLDTWYIVDFDFFCGTNGFAKMRIDEEGTTYQSDTTQTGTEFSTGIRFGTSGADATFQFHLGGLIVGGTGADFPFESDTLIALAPNSSGAHSFTTGDFQDQTSTNISSPSGDVHSFIDDAANGGDPNGINNTTDYIKQVVIRDTGYIAFGFQDMPGALIIEGVQAVTANHSNLTGANTVTLKFWDGTTETNIYAAKDVSQTTIVQDAIVYTAHPTQGSWTSQIVNDVEMRWGYSTDVTDNPYLDGVVLEVAYVASGATYRAFSQAQARIKQTYNVHGQTQAQIKQTYNVHAQSQAQIRQVYYALGQAQAQIKQVYYGLGQTQAKINAFNINNYGQANAYIMVLVAHDNFNRVVASGWGTSSDNLIIWGDRSAILGSVDGNYGLAPINDSVEKWGAWGEGTNGYPLIGFGIAQFDYWVPATANMSTSITYNIDFLGTAWSIGPDTDAPPATDWKFQTLFVSPQITSSDFTPDESSWYTFKFMVVGIGETREIHAKTWKVGTQEPDWQASNTVTGAVTPAYWLIQSDDESSKVDNLYIWRMDSGIVHSVSGNARAWIWQYKGWGQAQAVITGGFDSVVDTFTRTVSNGLGTADTGGDYTQIGSASTQWDVDGSKVIYTASTTLDSRQRLLSVYTGRPAYEVTLDFRVTSFGAGTGTSTISAYLSNPSASASTGIGVRVTIANSDGTLLAMIREGTSNSTTENYGAIVVNEWWHMKAHFHHSYSGGEARFKVWKDGNTEPGWTGDIGSWSQVNNSFGVPSIHIDAGNSTNIIETDNFFVTPIGWTETGQTRARITGLGLPNGQANAYIKSINYAVGQAEASIEPLVVFPYILGQAQAHIKTFDVNRYGQAQARIFKQIFFDDFNRTVASGFGTASNGFTYVLDNANAGILFSVVPSYAIIDGPSLSPYGDFKWERWAIHRGIIEYDFRIPAIANLEELATARYSIVGTASDDLTIEVVDSLPEIILQAYPSEAEIEPVQIDTFEFDTWYRAKYFFSDVSGEIGYLKFWKVGDIEPDWQDSGVMSPDYRLVPHLAFYALRYWHAILQNYQIAPYHITNIRVLRANDVVETNGLGQAQAQIKQVYYGLGQAQAWIEQTYYVTGQANAYIKTININRYGQAQARINSGGALTWLKDTFTRTLTNDLGTPDIGPTWMELFGTGGNKEIDGSKLILQTNDPDVENWVDADVFPPAHNIDVTIEFTVPNFGPTDADGQVELFLRVLPGVGGHHVSARASFGGSSTVRIVERGQVGDSIGYTFDYGITYILKSRVSGNKGYAKIWEKGTTEPDWMVRRTIVSPDKNGGIGIYADISDGVNISELWIDNILVTEVLDLTPAQAQAQIKQTYYGLGQAQAEIFNLNTYYVHGQAQAWIEQTYYGLGQSQAWIENTYFGLGQSNAWIENTYSGLGQANAQIKQTYYGLGQAQATIRGNAHGQAQGQVKQVYYGLGQAQADIKQTYYGLGQANAWIEQTFNVHAQAQAQIKQAYYGLGQAQAQIKQTYYGLGQARAWIENTYYGLGQSQAWVEQTYFALGQAQARILTRYNAHAQAQAQIKQVYSAVAQAQAQIKQSYTQTGQAHALIRQTYYVHGQAHVWIEQTYYALGQAQAQVKQTYYAVGQSQARILQVYNSVAQAQAAIKNTYYVVAQAQASIINTYYVVSQAQAKLNAYGVNQFGQAQGNIKFDGNAVSGQAQAKVNAYDFNQHGQANAQIKQIYYAVAQAQAQTLQTYYAHGQAQAWIESTYFGSGQAQGSILQVYYATGQAQAYIILTGQNAFGQAAAIIRDTYYGSGQANVKINAYGVNVHGQAQGYVLSGRNSHGQANAYIKAIDINVHGQAQGWVETTYNVHGQGQAQVKNTYSVHGQANAVIVSTYMAHGQGHAWIENTYNGLGQAQGSVKQAYTNVGQAQAQIKNTYSGSGQSNALIGTRNSVCGQAQGTIKTTYNQHGQANADILQVYVVHGNTQALIKDTYSGSGQANTYIILNRFAVAQAQAAILAVYRPHGQAQGAVLATYSRSGQAQARVKTTTQAHGQAQALILNRYNASGQAQGAITNGGFAFGQAQAQIVLIGLVSVAQAQAVIVKAALYGQAQALIVTVHTLKNVTVDDDRPIIITLASDVISVTLDDDAENSVEANDFGITIELEDEIILVLEIDDEAF